MSLHRLFIYFFKILVFSQYNIYTFRHTVTITDTNKFRHSKLGFNNFFVIRTETKNNQSVNDTEAHHQLGKIDYELKFLKSVRQFYAQARAPSSKLNKIEIG